MIITVIVSGYGYSSLLGYCIYPDVLLDNPCNLPSMPATCLFSPPAICLFVFPAEHVVRFGI